MVGAIVVNPDGTVYYVSDSTCIFDSVVDTLREEYDLNVDPDIVNESQLVGDNKVTLIDLYRHTDRDRLDITSSVAGSKALHEGMRLASVTVTHVYAPVAEETE